MQVSVIDETALILKPVFNATVGQHSPQRLLWQCVTARLIFARIACTIFIQDENCLEMHTDSMSMSMSMSSCSADCWFSALCIGAAALQDLHHQPSRLCCKWYLAQVMQTSCTRAAHICNCSMAVVTRLAHVMQKRRQFCQSAHLPRALVHSLDCCKLCCNLLTSACISVRRAVTDIYRYIDIYINAAFAAQLWSSSCLQVVTDRYAPEHSVSDSSLAYKHQL